MSGDITGFAALRIVSIYLTFWQFCDIACTHHSSHKGEADRITMLPE